MGEAVYHTGADLIIKIDSDIILNSLDWVQTTYNPMVRHIGFHIGEEKHHISGCCYSLPAHKIKDMLGKLEGLNYGECLGESIIMSDISLRIGLIP